MSNILVVSPHMDDETIGAGGTLLRFAKEGRKIYWLNIANTKAEYGYDEAVARERKRQREAVAAAYGMAGVFDLELSPARLDEYRDNEVIPRVADVVSAVKPAVLILPFPGDVHSDHGRVFSWLKPFTKSFRNDSVRTVLTMEIVSETDFAIGGDAFEPNYFVDITDVIEEKIRIAKLYEGEIPDRDFPRSAEMIRTLAQLRGSVAGTGYAEAFRLLRHIER
jgi:LmbE family N-acetylglucosaminyl deacetylase